MKKNEKKEKTERKRTNIKEKKKKLETAKDLPLRVKTL